MTGTKDGEWGKGGAVPGMTRAAREVIAELAFQHRHTGQWLSADSGDIADFILAALEQAGYVVVPVEPSAAVAMRASQLLGGDGSYAPVVGSLYRAIIGEATKPSASE
jgi:hypothetical protein